MKRAAKPRFGLLPFALLQLPLFLFGTALGFLLFAHLYELGATRAVLRFIYEAF